MSALDHDADAPPVGEEIHLPNGSLHPVMVTVGVTIALLGLTTSIGVTIFGSAILLITIALWVRDARREYAELPLEHHGPH